MREAVDGRSQGLKLTESGRRIAHKARAIMEDLEAGLLKRIPQADRAAFLRVLVALGRCEEG